MPRSFVRIIALLAVFLFSMACAQVQNIRVEPRLGFSEAPVIESHYWKKGAITLKPIARNEFGRQAENLLLQTLIDTVGPEAEQLRLLSPGDSRFPDFMKRVDLSADPQATFELHRKARLQGFHCLLQAGVLDIRPVEKKKGVWWFRGTKYYLNVVVTLDLYDTFTAAKISSQVMEELVRISSSASENYRAGMPDNIEAVDEAIVAMAETMGESAAKQIDTNHWMAAVAEAQGGQVRLAADRESGLEQGDRFSIFEGRRIADGLNGEKFIVPGYKVADVEIIAVGNDSATARSEATADIQPGDIAIPSQ